MEKVDFVYDDTIRQQNLKRKRGALEDATIERNVRPKRGHSTLQPDEGSVLRTGQKVPEAPSSLSTLTSVKNRLFSISARAVASIREFKDDISVLFVSRPLQQVPNFASEEKVAVELLTDLEDDKDERSRPQQVPKFASEEKVAVELPADLEDDKDERSRPLTLALSSKPRVLRPATNCLRLHLNGNLHREVWDPSEYGVCVFTGYVYFNSKDAAGDREPLPKLTNLLLELRVKPPRSKSGPKKDVCIARTTVPPVKTSNTSEQSVEPVSKGAPATRGRKTASPLPRPSVNVHGIERKGEEQRVKFTLAIPVGGMIFQSYSTSSITRIFTIEATGIAKSVAGGSTSIYKCGTIGFKFSITALKREELMDGRRARVRLPADEESRRSLIRDY